MILPKHHRMKYSGIIFIILLGFSVVKGQDSENFDLFLFKFASDPAFQLSRIQFPLKLTTWSNPYEVGGETVIKEVKKEDWNHDYLFAVYDARAQVYDNHEGKLRDTDERMFQWIGVENGVNVKYFFKRINGEWFLVAKESLGS